MYGSYIPWVIPGKYILIVIILNDNEDILKIRYFNRIIICQSNLMKKIKW